jgi:hypothetical protein
MAVGYGRGLETVTVRQTMHWMPLNASHHYCRCTFRPKNPNQLKPRDWRLIDENWWCGLLNVKVAALVKSVNDWGLTDLAGELSPKAAPIVSPGCELAITAWRVCIASFST